MGRDKALMPAGADGRTLLALVAAAARQAGLEVLVVGRTADALPPDMPPDCHAIPDEKPGRGPLGGLQTALHAAHGADVILCACDVPRITPACFRWLRQQSSSIAGHCPGDGIVPVWQGYDQPLFALYRQSAAPLVSELIARDSLSMNALLRAGRFLRVDLPIPLAGAVTDWDTPTDIELNPASR